MQELISRFENLKVHWFDVSVVIAVAMIVAFIRVREQMPQLYPDEFLYATALRGENRGDLPNYFYTLLYKPTTLCGDAFYTCTKGLNVVFFGVLLIFTFLIARKMVLLPYALLFVGFIGFGPLSGFTTLATPEMLFFVLTFAIIVLFQYFKTETVVFWLAQATLNALLMLTKPHGVFVTLGLVAYLIFLGIRKMQIVSHLTKAIGFFITSYVLVVVVRFVLSGNLALNPLGSRYSGAISQSGQTISGGSETFDASYFHPLSLIWTLIQQFASHISIGLAIVTVGLLMYIVTTLRNNEESIDLLYVTVFGALIVGTAIFSTLAVFWGELLQTRLMPRYYEHLLLLAPLFFLRSEIFKSKWLYLGASGFIGIVLILIEGKYITFPFDSYFFGIWVSLDIPLALLALPSIVIGLLLLKSIQSAKVATFGALLFMIILFNVNYQIMSPRFNAISQEVTEIYLLREYLAANSQNTLFISADINEYNRVKFWLPENNTMYFNDQVLTSDELNTYRAKYDVIVVLKSAELGLGITPTNQTETFKVVLIP